MTLPASNLAGCLCSYERSSLLTPRYIRTSGGLDPHVRILPAQSSHGPPSSSGLVATGIESRMELSFPYERCCAGWDLRTIANCRHRFANRPAGLPALIRQIWLLLSDQVQTLLSPRPAHLSVGAYKALCA